MTYFALEINDLRLAESLKYFFIKKVNILRIYSSHFDACLITLFVWFILFELKLPACVLQFKQYVTMCKQNWYSIDLFYSKIW